jgi:hypothetical protein
MPPFANPFRWIVALLLATLLLVGGLWWAYQGLRQHDARLHRLANHRAEVVWRPDQSLPQTRLLEPWTREKLAADYRQAWHQQALSYFTGDTTILYAYFSGPLRQQLATDTRRFATQQLQVTQTDSTHHLTLHVYSLDGQFVTFTDDSLTVRQTIRHQDSGLLLAQTTQTGCYEVQMALEEGYWRIHSLIKTH